MTEYKNTMLISPTTVKSYGALNINVDDALLGNCIRTSQDVYLKDIVGDTLVERLQELVYNKIQGEEDNIDSEGNEAYKQLLDDYVTPVLVYKVVVETAVRITLKIRNMGTVKNSDVNVNQVQAGEMKYIASYNETVYVDYVNKMVKFLCQNSSAYPEYDFDCKCGNAPLYANNNLWLG